MLIERLVLCVALALPLPVEAQRAGSTVQVGTSADQVIAIRGRTSAPPVVVGRDEHGLLVEWRYVDATYLMGRRVRGGVEAYRVLKITRARR